MKILVDNMGEFKNKKEFEKALKAESILMYDTKPPEVPYIEVELVIGRFETRYDIERGRKPLTQIIKNFGANVKEALQGFKSVFVELKAELKEPKGGKK